MKPEVLLIVGHQPWSPGARNKGKQGPEQDVYEYWFNRPLVSNIMAMLQAFGIDARQDEYHIGEGNVAGWDRKSQLLIEFHCNAFDMQASGTEVLYAEGSEKGQKCATVLLDHLVQELKLPNRGIKPKVRSDRGGYLLWGVQQVALIPEPFFIDNDADLARARECNLAGAYARGIEYCVRHVLREK
jgi:N-acetylmuramoyl-L-alanine amidase